MTILPCLKVFRIYITAICLIMIGCAENSELKLEVKNKQLHYVSIEDMQHAYKNEAERKKAANVVTYVLTNPSNKKVLFFFDKVHLEPGYKPVSSKNLYSGYMGFYIWNKENTVKKFSLSAPFWAERGELSGCDLYNIVSKRNTYNALGIEDRNIDIVDNFIRNSIILNPGETRTFKVLIHLPIIQERDPRTETPPMYYQSLEDTDTFQLFYYCMGSKIKKALPKYLLEELKNNEVEIFEGELRSNATKLKK